MIAGKELPGLDRTQNVVLSAALHPIASTPASPVCGQVWALIASGVTVQDNGTGTSKIVSGNL